MFYSRTKTEMDRAGIYTGGQKNYVKETDMHRKRWGVAHPLHWLLQTKGGRVEGREMVMRGVMMQAIVDWSPEGSREGTATTPQLNPHTRYLFPVIVSQLLQMHASLQDALSVFIQYPCTETLVIEKQTTCT